MNVVIDTNVFISGVFFSGAPYEILNAWRNARIQPVLSPEIIDEYQATASMLAEHFPAVDISPWLELILTTALLVKAPALSKQICKDPDDDKFLACALSGNCKYIISGDKALVASSGFKGITVLTPRQFIDRHLK